MQNVRPFFVLTLMLFICSSSIIHGAEPEAISWIANALKNPMVIQGLSDYRLYGNVRAIMNVMSWCRNHGFSEAAAQTQQLLQSQDGEIQLLQNQRKEYLEKESDMMRQIESTAAYVKKLTISNLSLERKNSRLQKKVKEYLRREPVGKKRKLDESRHRRCDDRR